MRLIDADKIIKWADDSVAQYGGTYSTDMLNMFGLFKHIIDNAPTVEPTFGVFKSICCEDCDKNARPQGEWIFERMKGRTYSDFVFCSECQKPNGFYETNFCPNCGAEMKRKPRDCEHCKHYVERDGSQGCESWDCHFEDREDG